MAPDLPFQLQFLYLGVKVSAIWNTSANLETTEINFTKNGTGMEIFLVLHSTLKKVPCSKFSLLRCSGQMAKLQCCCCSASSLCLLSKFRTVMCVCVCVLVCVCVCVCVLVFERVWGCAPSCSGAPFVTVSKSWRQQQLLFGAVWNILQCAYCKYSIWYRDVRAREINPPNWVNLWSNANPRTHLCHIQLSALLQLEVQKCPPANGNECTILFVIPHIQCLLSTPPDCIIQSGPFHREARNFTDLYRTLWLKMNAFRCRGQLLKRFSLLKATGG